MTTPMGRTVRVIRDNQGRVVSVQSGTFAPQILAYDSRGRLSTVTSGSAPSTRQMVLAYDPHDRVSVITNPASQSRGLGYDADNHNTSEARADGAVILSTFDLAGTLMSFAPPGRPVHEFGYTVAGDEALYSRPSVNGEPSSTTFAYNLDRDTTRITRPDGGDVLFGYDGAGRMATATFARGEPGEGVETVTLSYGAADGHLTSVSTGSGQIDAYGYDGPLLLSETASGLIAGVVARSYDSDFNVVSESVNGTDVVPFAYDGDGLLVLAGGLTLARDPVDASVTSTNLGAVPDARLFNEFGELVDYQAGFGGSPMISVHSNLDSLGRVAESIESIGGVTTIYNYSYDLGGRLSQVTKDGAIAVTYGYSSNGNRLSRTTSTETRSGTYDARDRLLAYGTYSYEYGANGALAAKTQTSSGDVTRYGYDGMQRLRRVELPGGATIEYVMDGLGRRIGKKVNGTIVKGWLYRDGSSPIAELDGSGAVVSRFVYGERPTTPEFLVRGGRTLLSSRIASGRRVSS